MTVFVDELREYPPNAIKPGARRFGRHWSHLWSNESDEELHAMAKRIGLRREWFQQYGSGSEAMRRFRSHYDVTPPKRAAAIAAGAVVKSTREAAREIARKLIAAGALRGEDAPPGE